MGDYLDVNGKSAFGSELASAASISEFEQSYIHIAFDLTTLH